MVESWDGETTKRLRNMAQMESAMRFSKVIIKRHTDKSKSWTTSRLPFFIEVLASSVFEVTNANPLWQVYHPLTPFADLHHLTSGQLVCIAGRVIEPTPEKKTIRIRSEDVPVTNASIRNESEWIRLAAWRDVAEEPLSLQVGQAYLFEAVRVATSEDGKVECRYTTLTDVRCCPTPLMEIMDAGTTTGREGATMLSRLGGQRDVSTADAHWFSLSLCEAICAPGYRRSLTDVVQIPSVLMSLNSDELTYLGCKTCKKKYHDGAPACSCKEESTHDWRAEIVLTDGSAQVTATIFDALADVVEAVLGFEEARILPETFEVGSDNYDDLIMSVGAIPFTVLITFSDNDYLDCIGVVIRKAKPTFDVNGCTARHPLKVLPRFKSDTSSCPPVALSLTKFSTGAGLSLLPTGSVASFRALLHFTDHPKGVKRCADGATLKVVRQCACAIHADTDDKTYIVMQNGPLELTSRLLAIQKDDFAHAVVSWRGSEHLTLHSYYKIPKDAVIAYKKMFKRETELHLEMFAPGGGHLLEPKEADNDDMTPTKVRDMATQAAVGHATPCRFDSRRTQLG